MYRDFRRLSNPYGSMLVRDFSRVIDIMTLLRVFSKISTLQAISSCRRKRYRRFTANVVAGICSHLRRRTAIYVIDDAQFGIS